MTNIAQRIWDHAATRPDAPALRAAGATWTYAELRRRCAVTADHLARRGVDRGQLVVLVAPTRPDFLSAYYGLLACGAVVVPVNVMATQREIAHVLRDCGARLLVSAESCAESGRRAAAAVGVELVTLEELARAVNADSGTVPLEVDDDHACMLPYTSGTTGQPKGTVLTHRNLRATHRSVADAVGLRADDVLATALPLFHIFGGPIVAGMTFDVGAAVTLIERFEPERVLDTLSRDHVSIYAGVPTMYNALLRHEGGPAQFPDLKVCISGGASLAPEILHGVERRFGVRVCEGYGMTEMTGTVSFTRVDHESQPGTAGVALAGVEIRIANDEGRASGADEVGEVLVRGPQLMAGYHRRPEATAEVLRDGWYHTGDLGTVDEDGVLRIVGRIKELIIRGGYNVYPREVEEVLIQHPDVVDIAVVGVPDEHYGQEVAAMLTVRPGSGLDGPALRAWAKEQLSGYKVPHLFAFVDELPKGPSGKILKRAISAEQFS